MQRWERASANFTAAIQDASRRAASTTSTTSWRPSSTALRDAATAARSAIDTSPTDAKAAVGARRGGRQPRRDRRHRNADPGVVRAGDPRPHRRGLAGPRGQPRLDARRAAGGAAVGGRTAAQPVVRRLDGGADVGDADRRRLVRRDGDARGAWPTRRLTPSSVGAESMSDRRSSTPKPGSSTSRPICPRPAATAPARPSS